MAYQRIVAILRRLVAALLRQGALLEEPDADTVYFFELPGFVAQCAAAGPLENLNICLYEHRCGARDDIQIHVTQPGYTWVGFLN